MKMQTTSLFHSSLLSSFFRLIALLLVFGLTSCTSIITSTVINPAVTNLQKQSDIDLVCEGAASYLLMIDSLIEGQPGHKSLLLNGVKSYSGTTAALSSCSAPEDRILAISSKARMYGIRLLEFYLPVTSGNLEEIEDSLEALSASSADSVFWGAFGWLSWVQQQQGSPQSMADLVIIEKIMARLLELNESLEHGAPHLFFGALYGAKPTLVGGDPEKSRAHFERALELSKRANLLVQTTYAETYCRMTFNQELHDTLLQEVLDYPLEAAPSMTLANQIAKRKALQLLNDGYFD